MNFELFLKKIISLISIFLFCLIVVSNDYLPNLPTKQKKKFMIYPEKSFDLY